MSKPEFVYVTYIETTPEKLWEALTDSDFTERYWFGTEVRSDWKVGSPFALVDERQDHRRRRGRRSRSAAAAVLHLQARAPEARRAKEPAVARHLRARTATASS